MITQSTPPLASSYQREQNTASINMFHSTKCLELPSNLSSNKSDAVDIQTTEVDDNQNKKSSSGIDSWASSLVGREWEIFWKPNSSTVTMKNSVDTETMTTATNNEDSSNTMVESDDDDSSERSEFLEDWYDATIVGYLSPNNNEKNRSSQNHHALFDVVFLGDEEHIVHKMRLSKRSIRPSARAWVKRTLYMIQNSNENTFQSNNGINSWFDSLPVDTSTTNDQLEFDKIHEKVSETDFPIKSIHNLHSIPVEDGCVELVSSLREIEIHHKSICQLLEIIQQQLYLRKKLAFIKEDNDSSDDEGNSSDDESNDVDDKSKDNNDDDAPTEEYLEFLVLRLHELQKYCMWHYSCYSLLCQVFNDNNETPQDEQEDQSLSDNDSMMGIHHTKMSLEHIYQDYIETGKGSLLELTQMSALDLSSVKNVTTSCATEKLQQPNNKVGGIISLEAERKLNRKRYVGRSRKRQRVPSVKTTPVRMTRSSINGSNENTPDDNINVKSGSGETHNNNSSNVDNNMKTKTNYCRSSSDVAFNCKILASILLNNNSNSVNNKEQCEHDFRWYTHCATAMLQFFLTFLIDPILQWEERANQLLDSSTTTPKQENLMNDFEQEKKCDDHSYCENSLKRKRCESNDESSLCWVQYEELEKHINIIRNYDEQHSLHPNNVFIHFNLNEVLMRKLRDKLSAVDYYESRVRKYVDVIFDDSRVINDMVTYSVSNRKLQQQNDLPSPPTNDVVSKEIVDVNTVSLQFLKQSDTTLKAIINLLDEVSSSIYDEQHKDLINPPRSSSLLFNMCTLGKGGMTRCTLKDLILYREWFLDMKYAELKRERKLFLHDVICRFYSLPQINFSVIYSDDSIHRQIPITLLTALQPIVMNRVQIMSSRCIPANMINEYDYFLTNRAATNSQLLQTIQGAQYGLERIRKESSVVSLVEEMLAIRIDVLLWKNLASDVFMRSVDDTMTKQVLISDYIELKKSLDILLDGRSRTRSEIVINLSPNVSVDDEIRGFVRSDLEFFCQSLYLQASELCNVSLSWLLKADLILSTQRLHENNDKRPVKCDIPPMPLIDIKSIDELLNETISDRISRSSEYGSLAKIQKLSYEWSSEASHILAINHPETSFENLLHLVQQIEVGRPHGIDIHPTQTTLKELTKLLTWYITAKKLFTADGAVPQTRANIEDSLVAGWCVVEFYCKKMRSGGSNWFLDLGDTIASWLSKDHHQKLVMSTLKSNQLTSTVIDQMTDTVRDEKEGFPILQCLYVVWVYAVKDFILSGKNRNVDVENFSLSTAKKLLDSCPTNETNVDACQEKVASKMSDRFPAVRELEELVKESYDSELRIRSLLSHAKCLRCDFQPSEIASYVTTLKEEFEKIQLRHRNKIGLSVDLSLENLLKQEVMLFEWLVEALRYTFLSSENSSERNKAKTPIHSKIAMDALGFLYSNLTVVESQTLTVTMEQNLVANVKTFYKAAREWQDEALRWTVCSNYSKNERTQMPNVSRDLALSAIISEIKGMLSNPLLSMVSYSTLSHCCVSSIIYIDEPDSEFAAKVDIPERNILGSILESCIKFEEKFSHFIGRDYAGCTPDRVPIPEAGSLIDDEGSLILFRLTDGPLFPDIKVASGLLSEIGDNIAFDVVEKTSFFWVKSIIEWIQKLRSCVTESSDILDSDRLIIGGAPARSMIEKGEATLISLSEELVIYFERSDIFIATTEEGKLSVECKRERIHDSLVEVVIQWFSFLLDGLKTDVETLDEWEALVLKSSQDFMSFRTKVLLKPVNDTSVLLKYYEFREIFRQILYEATNFFIFPSELLLDLAKSTSTSIEKYIKFNSTCDASQMFAEKKYRLGESVILDRFRLLDALLSRRSISTKCSDLQHEQEPEQGFFRSSLRLVLQRALSKNSKQLGVADSLQGKMPYFCSLRAWEIERALFESYQLDLSESLMSPEYRDKARSIRRGLEDSDNMFLCAEVLTGEVSADSLVCMSIDELANSRIKKEREAATDEARRGMILTGETRTSLSSEGMQSNESKNLKPETIASSNISEKIEVLTTESTPLGSTVAPIAHYKPTESMTPKEHVRAETVKAESPSSSVFENIMILSRPKAAPPPPPPSLATTAAFSSKSGLVKKDKTRSKDIAVLSSSGGIEFLFSVAEGSRKFQAALYVESDVESRANGVLPRKIVEKGRLPVSEFSKFIQLKLSGGRWLLITLYCCIKTENDKREYKKFNRDYEEKERIAMFGLSNGSKLFLLTPKFHEYLKEEGVQVTLQHSKSPYLVLLVRSDSS